LEAPEIIQAEGKLASYSVDTVRRFRQRLGRRDKLFFLVGIDAFLDISTWRDPVELLRECEFIVASRPGFSLADAAMALPRQMRPRQNVARLFKDRQASGPLLLSGASLHFLEGVYEPESSTVVRQAVRRGSDLKRFVAPPVAEYIRRLHLYRNQAEPGSPELPTPSPRQKGQAAGRGPRLVAPAKRQRH
jgi:nicotinate-nucleotide adenylyltransferase